MNNCFVRARIINYKVYLYNYKFVARSRTAADACTMPQQSGPKIGTDIRTTYGTENPIRTGKSTPVRSLLYPNRER